MKREKKEITIQQPKPPKSVSKIIPKLSDVVVDGKFAASKDDRLLLRRDYLPTPTLSYCKLLSTESDGCVTLYDYTIGRALCFNVKEAARLTLKLLPSDYSVSF